MPLIHKAVDSSLSSPAFFSVGCCGCYLESCWDLILVFSWFDFADRRSDSAGPFLLPLFSVFFVHQFILLGIRRSAQMSGTLPFFIFLCLFLRFLDYFSSVAPFAVRR